MDRIDDQLLWNNQILVLELKKELAAVHPNDQMKREMLQKDLRIAEEKLRLRNQRHFGGIEDDQKLD